jgi:uncharacterized membrane protein YphA (DoxX/SURF4 family)
MKPNPISHVIEFLTQPAWPTAVYWLLMLASVAVAVYALVTSENQRTVRDIGSWACRFVIGSMWWQQSLWKIPPYYTDQPSRPMDSGLAYWVTEMGKSAWIPWQADFVNDIVLPYFHFFAPIVYGLEVLTAISLMLGLFVRFWSVIGALQIINIWLGLYDAPGEWPWTYFFLIVLQVVFAIDQYGRRLGVDGLIAAHHERTRAGQGGSRRILGVST